jgi:hypothetical protein
MAQHPFASEVDLIFKKILTEYSSGVDRPLKQDKNDQSETLEHEIDTKAENAAIVAFLTSSCACGHECQKLFSYDELLEVRAKFRMLSISEKNSVVIALLSSFSRHSEQACSARSKTSRIRQKFEYQINIDRPVCRDAFLFYYGETPKRLKRLQKKFFEGGLQPTIHGNTNRVSNNACSELDRENVKSFISSFAHVQGLPDPGRDIRKGKGRLRILLPSLMSYKSIYAEYEESISKNKMNPVSYCTFIDIWKKDFAHICFNAPRTDLCMTCENFKKQLHRATAALDEEKEKEQARIYQEALDHLKHVSKERAYYKANIEVAKRNYENIALSEKSSVTRPVANSRDMLMHYSWDFAQQLFYPFEDQQVGPIYFKIPRRAQLFGVCCEGIPSQVNYLIDEADFLEKNANMVISLLDHFFSNHGLGEKTVYLTADNCVGQNKNNALMQYLMYRTLAGLHSNVEMSFLVVGHTKFSPDAYFGLTKQSYRRSKVYTYEQLVSVIEKSCLNGHNRCQRYLGDVHSDNVVYRDWSTWLSNYFKMIPGITNYHYFKMNSNDRGVIFLKEEVDSDETKFKLLKKEFCCDFENQPKGIPQQLIPSVLSPERQWYLYDKIRIHIPNEIDKDDTCPKPKIAKPKNNGF